MRRSSLLATLREAVADFIKFGYDNQERLEYWLRQLRETIEGAMLPERVLRAKLTSQLEEVYNRTVKSERLFKRHKGLSQFTLQQLKPNLRKELDKRILASANLIRLNREASIQRTLQRFSGWATSIPTGGSNVATYKALDPKLKRAFASLPFEERRVIIDQGHKLVSAVNQIVAEDGGAIAGVWNSHYHQVGYNYRVNHKEFDQASHKRPLVVRNNWAISGGLMKDKGPYTDQIVQTGEEPFCRCYYTYLYSLRDLPREMLTKAGMEKLLAANQLRKAA
jgi:hypothetical protein